MNEKRFDWPVCHEAEGLIVRWLEAFQERNPVARQLSRRMGEETGTLLMDWVDHLVLAPSHEQSLRVAGFSVDALAEAGPGQMPFHHPEAMLPRMVLDQAVADNGAPARLGLRVEELESFARAHHLNATPQQPPLSRFRQLEISAKNGACLVAIERRGYRGFVPHEAGNGPLETWREDCKLWANRRRTWESDAEGYGYSLDLLDQLVARNGCDRACHIVFEVERAYWQGRNRAAQVQKARQDSLGLGWANHDHHTFRSSRRHFVDLMSALEKLGFERRERYYAGAQAGWGAQILEQQVEGLVAFCDVDLLPDETEIDFSRRRLPEAPGLGTIGLWVGLHGESFLDAGLHHLECRFDYQKLRDQLAPLGVTTMKPFSDLPFLKQAFTEGERWQVRPARADRLLAAGSIDPGQHRKFLSDGALGSHLENLQRWGGFKGFNQKSVSAIIQATDPRGTPGHAALP